MSIWYDDIQLCSCKVSDLLYIRRELIFAQLTRARESLSIDEAMLEVVVQILFFCSCVLLNKSKDNASVVGVLSK